MSRQIQLHILPQDLNDLLLAFASEPLFVAMKHGATAAPEPLAFASDNLAGKGLVIWNKRFSPVLQRDYVAQADPPYYLINEQSESVLDVSMSGFTSWRRRSALMQGRIYGVFENKDPEFAKWYERIARFIRRHWHKNPASWMSGYIGPAANQWFESGGLLLPNYVPPVRNDWIERLGQQHPGWGWQSGSSKPEE